jgi:hypothetical protein
MRIRRKLQGRIWDADHFKKLPRPAGSRGSTELFVNSDCFLDLFADFQDRIK